MTSKPRRAISSSGSRTALCSISVLMMCRRPACGAVVGESEDGQVVAFRCAAGEYDFFRLGIDDCGDLPAGAVDAVLSGLPVGVGPAACVAELLGKVGEDLGLDARVDRGGGVAVQVHRPCSAV